MSGSDPAQRQAGNTGIDTTPPEADRPQFDTVRSEADRSHVEAPHPGPDPAVTDFESSAEFDWSHPEADPSHPRYEPPHLRHRPGDTWQIGGKPFDIDDTGPYGNPLWRPDRRTGRHRRGELPDPLPPETESGPDPEPDPESPPPPVDRPSPGPARRGFWTETNPDRQPRSHPTDSEGQRTHHSTDSENQRFTDPPAWERRRLESETDHPQINEHRLDGTRQDGPRFDRLREDAWGAFMTDSAPLAAAHHTQRPRPRRQTAFDREAGLALAMWIRLARWLLAVIRTLNAGGETKPAPQEIQSAGKRRDRSARQRTGPAPACVAAPGQGSAPSGRVAFPQPGVPYGPDRREPTGPTVPVKPRARPVGANAATAGRQAPATTMTEGRPDSATARSRTGLGCATAMARAIAGAQRARAGVPAWA